MVYLAELLVVMFDQLQIARIRARNVPHADGHKRFDDDVSVTSLTPDKRRCRGARCTGVPCHSVKTHKKSSPDNLPMSGSALVSRQPAHVWHVSHSRQPAHVWQCPRLQTTCPCLAVPSSPDNLPMSGSAL